MKKIKILLCALVVALFGSSLIGCGFKRVTATDIMQQTTRGLEVEKEVEASMEYGFFRLKGTVKNNSDRNYTSVVITITFYDKDGAVIGSGQDVVQGLGAGERWKFNVMSNTNGETPTDYKVTQLYGI